MEASGDGRRAAFLKSVHDEMFEIASEALASRDLTQIVETAQEAARQTDAHVKTIFRIAEAKRSSGIPLPQVACRAGCSVCCSLTVCLSPFEALWILGFVLEEFSPEELADLKVRIREYAETKGSVPATERFRIMRPCVFLRDRRCRIYGVRPVACRCHHSVSLEACEKAYEAPQELGVPRFLEVEDGVTPIWKALQDAVRKGKVSGPRLNLPLAIGTLLEESGVFERWLEGDPVFAHAELS